MTTEIDYLIKKATEAENDKNYKKAIKYCYDILEIDSTIYGTFAMNRKSYFMLNDYDNSLKFMKSSLPIFRISKG